MHVTSAHDRQLPVAIQSQAMKDLVAGKGVEQAEQRLAAHDPAALTGGKKALLAEPTSFPDVRTLDEGVASKELTVKGLMESWGQSDDQYDLDGNGTVDMQDLVMLLARLAEQAGVEPEDVPPAPGAPLPGALGTTAPDPALGTTDPDAADGTEPELTVDGLLAAWGAKDDDYDLDGSGTVDMSDLNMLLARLSQEKDGGTGGTGLPDDLGTEGPVTESSVPGPGDPPTTPESPLTIEGILDAWGSADNRYDLDSNGSVDIHDLRMVMEKLGGPEQFAKMARDGLGTGEMHPNDVHRIAEKWHGILAQNGFRDTPPANLHGIMESLNLPKDWTQSLINELSAFYPNGLGVNVLG